MPKKLTPEVKAKREVAKKEAAHRRAEKTLERKQAKLAVTQKKKAVALEKKAAAAAAIRKVKADKKEGLAKLQKMKTQLKRTKAKVAVAEAKPAPKKLTQAQIADIDKMIGGAAEVTRKQKEKKGLKELDIAFKQLITPTGRAIKTAKLSPQGKTYGLKQAILEQEGKVKPRKRKMSQKQLDALAAGRIILAKHVAREIKK